MPRTRPAPSSYQASGAGAGEVVVLNDDAQVDHSLLPFVGTSWPSSPVDGQLFFKTDLADAELFFWDDSASAWLSVRTIEYVFGVSAATASGAQYLDVPGIGIGGGSPDFGYIATHDLIIQGVSFAATAVAATNYQLVARVNGSGVAAGILHTTSITKGSSGMVFSATAAAGDTIGVRATNNIPSKLVATVHCRRRVAP